MRRNDWTFLTNHGHVLVCLAADQEMLLRDVASRVGITERAVQQIVGDLEGAGIIERTRMGRRNHYLLRRGERFRHPLESGMTVGDFVDLVHQPSRSSAGPQGEAVPEEASLRPALRLVDDMLRARHTRGLTAGVDDHQSTRFGRDDGPAQPTASSPEPATSSSIPSR